MGLWFDEPPFSHMPLRALRRERSDWLSLVHNPHTVPHEANLARAYIDILTEWIGVRRAFLATPWHRNDPRNRGARRWATRR